MVTGDDTIYHKVIIIGAGPAGLQLAYTLQRKNVDYVILERDSIASFFTKFPRDGQLISFNKKYSIYDDPEVNLRWDWNSLLTDDYSHSFTDYSDRIYPNSSEMVEYLRDFANKFELKVSVGAYIESVERSAGNGFLLRDSNNNHYRCEILVVATGLSKLYFPDIPGIENVTETYANVSIDPKLYISKRILIIGKGNSGFELADRFLDTAALIHLVSPESVTLAWKTRHPGHVRSNYSRILDAYQLKTLHGALDANVLSIVKTGDVFHVEFKYIHADGEQETIEYDHVILCAGFKFSDDIFHESVKPALAVGDRLPNITGEWESTNVDNLFFCGTLMQARDFRVSASAFIDGFRYNARSLAGIIYDRITSSGLTVKTEKLNAAMLVDYVEKRVCGTSSLWTQFGSLCDIIGYETTDDRYVVYQDLPVEYHMEFLKERHPNRSVLTFEWGRFDGDVFMIERHPSNKAAYTNIFLHPIIRTFSGDKLVSTHHILEDLFGMYSERGAATTRIRIAGKSVQEYHCTEHNVPLMNYFSSVMQSLHTYTN